MKAFILKQYVLTLNPPLKYSFTHDAFKNCFIFCVPDTCSYSIFSFVITCLQNSSKSGVPSHHFEKSSPTVQGTWEAGLKYLIFSVPVPVLLLHGSLFHMFLKPPDDYQIFLTSPYLLLIFQS